MEASTRGPVRSINVRDVVAFKYEDGSAWSHRIAQFLDWCATKFPRQFVPYNLLTRAVTGVNRTPGFDSDMVTAMRNRMSGARKVLLEKYNRDLETQPEYGVRATVDSLDVVKTTEPKRVRRINSAMRSLEKTASIVDTKELPQSGPDKHWTEWHNRQVSPGVRAFATDPRLVKLLPPGESDAAERKLNGKENSK